MPQSDRLDPLSKNPTPLGALVICHSCHIAIRGGVVLAGGLIHYRLCDDCKPRSNQKVAWKFWPPRLWR